MMNSKPLRNGFVLMEPIVAITVIGFLLTSLLALQSNSFRRVVINTLRIENFYPIKEMTTSLLMNPLKKGETKREKRNDEVGIGLVYEQKPISGASALARFKGLYQKRTVGTWMQQGREKVQEMVGYGFTPIEPEKKS